MLLSKDERQDLRSKLQGWNGHKIIIIGDVGVDEYVDGSVKRISPEAPVPVVDVKKEACHLGLSANVAQNIASLGGKPCLISVVGDDGAAGTFKQLLKDNEVDCSSLVVDPERPTTRKLRVMAGPHHIVRVDYELRRFLKPEIEAKILSQLEANLVDAKGVIIQDYAKGVISESLVQGVVERAQKAGVPVLADPNRKTPLGFYQGVDLFKPNRDEAIILSGLPADELHVKDDLIERMGKVLMQKLNAKNVVLTQSQDGMTLFSADKIDHVPTAAKEVFDVTGAGDTVIAGLALAWTSGMSLKQACQIANIAAGIVVAHVGCVSCSIQELEAELAD